MRTVPKQQKVINLIRKLRSLFRGYYYKNTFGHFGAGSEIYGAITCNSEWKVFFGKKSTLNQGVFLNAKAPIYIGDYCHISPYVQIHTGSLDVIHHYVERPHVSKEVRIENGVWLCAGVIVLPGVIIGEGSVIAASSVVNQNVPPFELWGGIPAKKIRSINSE